MIVNANALTIPLADASVQCCVTSPPYYGLRDYGVDGQIGLEHTPEQFIANLVAVGREVWRVLADDGVYFLNIGDSYAGSSKGQGGNYESSKKQKSNRGAYFVSKSKRIERGSGRWGGGDTAVDGLPGKNLMMIPARVAIALQADGWYIRAEIIWAKPNPMPESVTDRPTRSHEMIYLLTKRAKYYYNADAVKEPAQVWAGQAATFERENGKATKLEAPGQTYASHRKGRKQDELGKRTYTGFNDRYDKNPVASRNQRDVWNIATQSFSGAHYATFPTEIPRRAILAGSKPGDIVLDPFCGSGTTGEVCRELGRRFVGLDLSMKYLTENALPRAEMKQTQASIKSLPLFGGDATIALSEMTP